MKKESKNYSNITKIMPMIWKKMQEMAGLRPLILKIKQPVEVIMLLTLMKTEMDNQCKLCQEPKTNRLKMMLLILMIVMTIMFLPNQQLKLKNLKIPPKSPKQEELHRLGLSR